MDVDAKHAMRTVRSFRVERKTRTSTMTHWCSILTIQGMAQPESQMHDLSMPIIRNSPSIGDRVQIAGFLGEFEVVQVRNGGLMADVRHLGSPGPDYIEEDILSTDLIYSSHSRHSALSPN